MFLFLSFKLYHYHLVSFVFTYFVSGIFVFLDEIITRSYSIKVARVCVLQMFIHIHIDDDDGDDDEDG